MKLILVAVGQRLPAWAEAGFAEYVKRFPPELRLELKPIKAEARTGRTTPQVMAAEAARIDAALPKGARRVVLDEHGTRLDTAALARRLTAWQGDGRDVGLVIGGADGLDPALKAGAAETWSLSALTLPHALSRVVVAEALYRAWTLTINHPYHRE